MLRYLSSQVPLGNDYLSLVAAKASNNKSFLLLHCLQSKYYGDKAFWFDYFAQLGHIPAGRMSILIDKLDVFLNILYCIPLGCAVNLFYSPWPTGSINSGQISFVWSFIILGEFENNDKHNHIFIEICFFIMSSSVFRCQLGMWFNKICLHRSERIRYFIFCACGTSPYKILVIASIVKNITNTIWWKHDCSLFVSRNMTYIYKLTLKINKTSARISTLGCECIRRSELKHVTYL